jgi:hypothetical protein
MCRSRIDILQRPEWCACVQIALRLRGCDAVAPVIHEWTYEAMAYDLLGLKGSTFKYESETAGGKTETKEHILDERDELWVSTGPACLFPHAPFHCSRVVLHLSDHRAQHL